MDARSKLAQAGLGFGFLDPSLNARQVELGTIARRALPYGVIGFNTFKAYQALFDSDRGRGWCGRRPIVHGTRQPQLSACPHAGAIAKRVATTGGTQLIIISVAFVSIIITIGYINVELREQFLIVPHLLLSHPFE
jgi:hypothetical protein